MQLTDDQKKRFLEYVERRKQETLSKESVEDIATFCINDIFKKAEKVEFYLNSNEEKKLNFKINVVNDILISFLKNITNKILELDLQSSSSTDLTDVLVKSGSMQEFFEAINFYIMISPILSFESYKYIALAYTQVCTKLHILADEQVLNILKD